MALSFGQVCPHQMADQPANRPLSHLMTDEGRATRNLEVMASYNYIYYSLLMYFVSTAFASASAAAAAVAAAAVAVILVFNSRLA
ncbi:hypothetical protein ElyMa_002736700 [Elysia marginata]|uniref:PRA1 family protein n=1 Tax=Elysia marginata TaxID=1093978 RepID=A0AAV4HH59_9GAST|nr:hypothetical protein ElyMa_002736700 [Elysia marginata]